MYLENPDIVMDLIENTSPATFFETYAEKAIKSKLPKKMSNIPNDISIASVDLGMYDGLIKYGEVMQNAV